ncbi:MAG: hypothetical protein K2X70_15425 [Candidatus Obscuribacterales bacterium]|jgi:hypothetical protein|nr:hypothetical protein [Candidatus Obscuribacterales bacterium]
MSQLLTSVLYCVTASLIASTCPGALALDNYRQLEHIAPREITAIIKGNTDVPVSCEPTAVIDTATKTVSIAIYKHKGASLNDLKIDAALLARDINARFDGCFKEFCFSFYDERQQSHHTSIHISGLDLGAFAAGAIDRHDFLSKISTHEAFSNELLGMKDRYKDLKYKEILALESNRLADGAKMDERRELLQGMQKLQSMGVDITDCYRQYLAAEDAARFKNDADLTIALEKAKIALAAGQEGMSPVSIAGKRDQWPR